jgi:hypothetical protein
MNFSEFQTRLYKQIQRDDLLADDRYKVFINDALQEIQKRRSFALMKKTADVVIANGTKNGVLPVDFKEFQNVRPPIQIVLNDPSTGQEVLKPVDVVFELQETNRVWNFGGLVWTVRIIALDDSGTKSIEIIVPAAEDLTFRTRYYRYLPALVADGDTSPFIDLYPQMVLWKAKEIAFGEINDFIAEKEAQMKFEEKFLRATQQDAFSSNAGLALRM